MTKDKTVTITDAGNVFIDDDIAKKMAEFSQSPELLNSLVMTAFNKYTTQDRVSLTEVIRTMQQNAEQLDGDKPLALTEQILLAQATSLNALYCDLAARASYQERIEPMELALKAQSQCRATLETLATVKNSPVVFAKQANIAHNQQINQHVTAQNAQSDEPKPVNEVTNQNAIEHTSKPVMTRARAKSKIAV